MTAPITRTMTEDERAWLRAQAGLSGQFTGASTVVVTLFGAAVYGVIAALVWLAFCWLTGLLPSGARLSDTPVPYWGTLIAVALAILFVSISMLRWSARARRSRRGALAAIRTDLDAGQVTVAQMALDAVKVFREPEHGMKIYALRLSDGRIRVRHDHDSADQGGSGASRRSSFPLARDVEMVTFPASGLVRYRFTGEPVRKPKALPLALHPRDWPEDESWSDIAWEDLDRVMTSGPSPGGPA